MTTAEAADPPIADDWRREGPFALHMARHATEHWVAEAAGKLVGWALSTEREGAFELVFFFVDPAAQSKGIGRGLLERAFEPGRGAHRIVRATANERALALYLRFGVHGVGSSLALYGRPKTGRGRDGPPVRARAPGSSDGQRHRRDRA